MVKMVLEELDTVLGLKANPQFSKVYRWYKGMPKYTVGHLERIALIDRMVCDASRPAPYRLFVQGHRHRRLRA